MAYVEIKTQKMKRRGNLVVRSAPAGVLGNFNRGARLSVERPTSAITFNEEAALTLESTREIELVIAELQAILKRRAEEEQGDPNQ